MREPLTPCSRTWTSSRTMVRATSCCWPATTSTRWTTKSCFASMWTPGADVTIGCLEVPRMEATGFGVMHVDGRDRVVDFVEKPKDPPGIPDKPDTALASMGIYVFETRFLMEQLRRDAQTEGSSRDFGKDIIPYIVKNGIGLGASLPALLRPLGERGSRLLARRRHDRRLLEGQYRSHRRQPAARPLRSRLADLDLCRGDAAGQVRARLRGPSRLGGELAGIGRLHRLGWFAQSHAAVDGFAGPFLFGAARSGGAAALHDQSRRAAQKVVVDRGVVIPEGLVVGEDPDVRQPSGSAAPRPV